MIRTRTQILTQELLTHHRRRRWCRSNSSSRDVSDFDSSDVLDTPSNFPTSGSRAQLVTHHKLEIWHPLSSKVRSLSTLQSTVIAGKYGRILDSLKVDELRQELRVPRNQNYKKSWVLSHNGFLHCLHLTPHNHWLSWIYKIMKYSSVNLYMTLKDTSFHISLT